MRVTVNGVSQAIPAGSNLSQLLSRLDIAPEQIAVEVNLAIIDKKRFPETRLKEGDRIEIIRFVGGGCHAE